MSLNTETSPVPPRHPGPPGRPTWSALGLWLLILVDILNGLWMGAVAIGQAPCHTSVCSISTLGGHEVLLGLTSLGCALALLVLAVVTGGFTRVAGTMSALLGVIALASIGSALGVLTALFVFLSTLAAFIGMLLVVAGTTERRPDPDPEA